MLRVVAVATNGMEDDGDGVEDHVATTMGVNDVGVTMIAAVVGFSPTCLRNCLGLFVTVKSELRRRDLGGDDDRQQVVYSMILFSAKLA